MIKGIACSQGHAMDYDNSMNPVTIFVGHKDERRKKYFNSVSMRHPLKVHRGSVGEI